MLLNQLLYTATRLHFMQTAVFRHVIKQGRVWQHRVKLLCWYLCPEFILPGDIPVKNYANSLLALKIIM